MIFYIKYLIKLIAENPVKSIAILVAIISFKFAGTFSSNTSTYKVISSSIDSVSAPQKVFLYTVKGRDGNGYQVISNSSPIKISTNDFISVSDTNPLNVLLWILFIISILIVVIGSFSDGGEWEFDDIMKEHLLKNIKCYHENGKYYYALRNRLLVATDVALNDPVWQLRYAVETYVKNKKIYPEFYSVQDKRNNKLDRIGL